MLSNGLKIALAAMVLLLATFSMVYLQTPYGLATTPDSINYLDIAASISQDAGVAVKDRSLSAATQASANYQAIRLWPSLYPRLLSFFVPDLTAVGSTWLLSFCLLAVSSLLVFFIVKQRSMWWFALLAGLGFIYLQPILTVYNYTWSETLFIPLLLLLSFSLSSFLKTRHFAFIFLATLVSIALLYTRYIGLIFIALIPFCLLKVYGYKKAFVQSMGLLSLYAAFAVYLLAENYQLTGYLSGGQRLASDTSLIQNLLTLIHITQFLFPTTIIMLAVTLLAVLILVASQPASQPASHPSIHPSSSAGCKTNEYILLISGSIYIVTLIALRTYSAFDVLDIRLFAPAIACFYPAIALRFWRYGQEKKALSQWLNRFLSLLILIALPIQGYLAFNNNLKHLRDYLSPSYALNHYSRYNNFTYPKVYDQSSAIIHQMLAKAQWVGVDMKPQIQEFVLGKKTFAIPSEISALAARQLESLPIHTVLLISKASLALDVLSHCLSYKKIAVLDNTLLLGKEK